MINQIIEKTSPNPALIGVKGDNLYMIYVFECGCELPTNYKRIFVAKINCGRHSINTLALQIENTKDWSEVKFLNST